MLNDVKSLYDLGGAIILLHPKSKRPVGNAWQTGPRALWSYLEKNYRDHNLGIRLGEPSRLSDGTYLIALDCDVKSQDPAHIIEMEKLLAAYHPMILNAPYVLSGRGGGSRHYYIRVKDLPASGRIGESKHKCKVKMPSVKPGQAERDALTSKEIADGIRIRNAWEVDLFSTGKQVAVPPSIHPDTGKEYRWGVGIKCLDDIPLVELGEAPKSLRVTNYNVKIDDTVDLFTLRLSDRMFALITSMQGLDDEPYHGDRSRAVNAAIWALIQCGLSDVQIASVLTDSNYDLSECALDRGKGDRKAAVKWLMPQIQKARVERVASDFRGEYQGDDVLTPAQAEAQAEAIIDWKGELKRDQSQKIRASMYNCLLILKNVPERRVFGYDVFGDRKVYISKPPWKLSGERFNQDITDVDYTEISRWIQANPEFMFPEFEPKKIRDVVHKLCMDNHFHPVRDYLKGLEWDGVKRLDTWLEYYCGAKGPRDYIRAVSRKTLTGAVARVMRPGIKFDYVLILEGKQGIGKSNVLRTLAGDAWFTDTLTGIEDKTGIECILNRWVVEVGEMGTAKKADIDVLKAFLTRQEDRARPAYGVEVKSWPRQCIFVGTTNMDEYLKDETGNRRFWPVKCTGTIKVDEIKNDRDQLWAEALVCFNAGEKLYLEDDIKTVAEIEQSARIWTDELDNKVAEFLDAQNPIENDGDLNIYAGFAMSELFERLPHSGQNRGSLDGSMQHRLGKILKNRGFEKRNVSEKGIQTKKWRKILLEVG